MSVCRSPLTPPPRKGYVRACSDQIGTSVTTIFEYLKAPSGFPQYVLTLDRIGVNETVRGIKVLNLVDWLLKAPAAG